ncbi:hypothetical protein EV426DRAFT_572316 [Tirmania nivea]|nr:hypothetical protein EV426DRAFT_572316 [Tirmania nivea]
MSSKKPMASSSALNAQNQSPPTASPRPATNIWQLMGYPIPRGPCRHKPGVLSSACACLRFMLNPVVAGSTFCCDGCGHHASFHVLKGEYSVGEGGEGMVGMGVGDIIQSQNQVHGHGQGQLVNLTPGKGRGKRVVELEFEDDDGDEEWLGDEAGDLMIVPAAKKVPKRRIPGAFTNGTASGSGTTSGNGTPAAKRSRV